MEQTVSVFDIIDLRTSEVVCTYTKDGTILAITPRFKESLMDKKKGKGGKPVKKC